MNPIFTYRLKLSFQVAKSRLGRSRTMAEPHRSLLQATFLNKLNPEEKNPPVRRADNVKGDGGVDVTGAPKSRSVEGADFGRIHCFSGESWSSDQTFPGSRQISVIIGGSNFKAGKYLLT